ncbi:hypothetical protein IEQ34_008804 [Dendrobium chrysotoxum]|uniref:Uncharacterized protein n=1 Tax=Dendrobium chrysotoxum TaxID=161865 RepID=A0AAV7GZN8_DENCH|nr:hypothetical protein IEQ34_008804 [Dendrobium chrysotoxum]
MSLSLSSSSQAESVLPPLPENRVVFLFFLLFVLPARVRLFVVDYLATVAAFPKPDDKIRSTSLKVTLLPAETRVTLDFTGLGVLTTDLCELCLLLSEKKLVFCFLTCCVWWNCWLDGYEFIVVFFIA